MVIRQWGQGYLSRKINANGTTQEFKVFKEWLKPWIRVSKLGYLQLSYIIHNNSFLLIHKLSCNHCNRIDYDKEETVYSVNYRLSSEDIIKLRMTEVTKFREKIKKTHAVYLIKLINKSTINKLRYLSGRTVVVIYSFAAFNSDE